MAVTSYIGPPEDEPGYWDDKYPDPDDEEDDPELFEQVREAFVARGWIIPQTEDEVKMVEDLEAERFRECNEGRARTIANKEKYGDRERCHAAMSDGECDWSECPQLRDGEPEKSGRHCPIDTWVDDDY